MESIVVIIVVATTAGATFRVNIIYIVVVVVCGILAMCCIVNTRKQQVNTSCNICTKVTVETFDHLPSEFVGVILVGNIEWIRKFSKLYIL